MKKLILCLAAVSLLGGCAAIREFFFGPPDVYRSWSNDCASHYSTTAREQSDCLKKVEDGKQISITPGEISVDPDNIGRETFDDIGKGGASDSNFSTRIAF